MTPNWVRTGSLLAFLILGSTPPTFSSDQFGDLIEKVRLNERLYDRIEMRTERDYVLSEGAPTIPGRT